MEENSLSLLVVGLLAPHSIPLVDVLVGLGVVEALVVHGSLRASLKAISRRGQLLAEARQIDWVSVGNLVVPIGGGGGGRRGSRRRGAGGGVGGGAGEGGEGEVIGVVLLVLELGEVLEKVGGSRDHEG